LAFGAGCLYAARQYPVNDSVRLVEARRDVREARKLWAMALGALDGRAMTSVEPKLVLTMTTTSLFTDDLSWSSHNKGPGHNPPLSEQAAQALRDAGFSEAIIAKGM